MEIRPLEELRDINVHLHPPSRPKYGPSLRQSRSPAHNLALVSKTFPPVVTTRPQLTTP
jgi:hypothetical protein